MLPLTIPCIIYACKSFSCLACVQKWNYFCNNKKLLYFCWYILYYYVWTNGLNIICTTWMVIINIQEVLFLCFKVVFKKYLFTMSLFYFQVITKSSSHHFSANSQDDMVKWISAFQTVAFRDNASRQTIEEDNDLYCSAGDCKKIVFYHLF